MTETKYIDCHAHFFPKKYLKTLRNLGINFNQILEPCFTSLALRLDDMDKSGILRQVISIAVPGVNLSTPENAILLAKTVNDELASLTADNERFIGIASLPMLNPGEAVEELDRAINDLGLSAVNLFTSIGGKPLDSKEFWIVYEKAVELNVPIFIHPIAPNHSTIFDDYRLLAVLGFPFETTHAATRLALSGVLEEHSDLKIILSHLGGALPYLIGRIDEAYRMYEKTRYKITKPPSEYLKKMYIDGASLYEPAWICALRLWRSENILMGSDYPYKWANPYSKCVEIVKSLDINDSDKELILWQNAEKLLSI